MAKETETKTAATLAPFINALIRKLDDERTGTSRQKLTEGMFVMDRNTCLHILRMYENTDWEGFTEEQLMATDLPDELTGEVSRETLEKHIGEWAYFDALEMRSHVKITDYERFKPYMVLKFQDDMLWEASFLISDILKNEYIMSLPRLIPVMENMRSNGKTEKEIEDLLLERTEDDSISLQEFFRMLKEADAWKE